MHTLITSVILEKRPYLVNMPDYFYVQHVNQDVDLPLHFVADLRNNPTQLANINFGDAKMDRSWFRLDREVDPEKYALLCGTASAYDVYGVYSETDHIFNALDFNEIDWTRDPTFDLLFNSIVLCPCEQPTEPYRVIKLHFKHIHCRLLEK